MDTTGRHTPLQEAITTLHATPAWTLPDTDLNTLLSTMATAWHHLATLIGRLALEADTRHSTRPHGYASAAMMLAHTAPLSVSRAHRLVKGGARIEKLPHVDDAYAPVTDARDRGLIPTPHAELIARFLMRYHNLIPDDAKDAVVATLVGFAQDPDTQQVKNALTAFRESLERDAGTPDPGEDRDLDSLYLSPMLNGRYKLDAELNKLCAEMLVTLLDAVGKPPTEPEGSPRRRQPEQLRADAFEELLRRCLASAPLPDNGGTRPSVNVIADYETLFGDDEQPGLFDLDVDPDTPDTPDTPDAPGASREDTDNGDAAGTEWDPDQLSLFDTDDDADDGGGDGCCDDHDHDHGGHAGGGGGDEWLLWPRRRKHTTFTRAYDAELAAMITRLQTRLQRRIAGAAKLGWTGTVTRGLARMIACDATLRPILGDRTGLPIDVGRARRTIPVDLRRYLVLRDRGCAFPGCRRPPSWCDAHHILWWSMGGTTDRHNLVLLCHHHHTIVHQGYWDVRMDAFEVPWFIPSARIDPDRKPRPANGRTPRTPTPTAA